MRDKDCDLQILTERVMRLETQNRRLRKAGIAAAVLISALLFMGQAQTGRNVTAEKFVLQDSDGKVRGELGMFCNGPCLRFFDAKGTPRNVVSSWGYFIESGDVEVPKDRNDMSKGFEFVKGPAVQLSQYGLHVDDKQQRRALVDFDWTQAADVPSLTLFAREQRNGKWSRVELSTSADGPSLNLSDAQDFSAVLGSSSLEMPRTGEMHKRPAASIVLFGKDGKVLWSAP